MGNIGFQEILFIALIALVVFGPDRLPELARSAGKALARFRQETSRCVAELKRAAELEDLDRELKAVRGDLRDLGREFTRATDPPRPGRKGAPPTDPEAT